MTTTSVAGAVLAGLGLTTKAAATPATPVPLFTWPPSLQPPVEGTVTSTGGDWDRSVSPHTRVTLLATPESTFRRLGVAVQAWLATMSVTHHPLPDATTLARALIAYHATDLDLVHAVGAGTPVSTDTFAAWQTGHTLALPVEFDATSVSPTFTTDLTLLAQLGASVGGEVDALLDRLPRPLALPDHEVDLAWATTAAAGVTAPATLATSIRTEVITNPYAAIYRMLALLGRLDDPAVTADNRTALLTTLVTTTFMADELALLATLTPGAVLIRALYRRLAVAADSAAVDTARTALLTALGYPAATSVDLALSGAPVVPRELPVTPAWHVRPIRNRRSVDANGERTDGLHDIVLGRSIFCGTVDTETYYSIDYLGPSMVGSPSLAPAAFMAAHGPELATVGDVQLAARCVVVQVIAPNEGFLDAVRLRDAAILGAGIQQWSADTDTELTPLLWQLRAQHRDDYDTHFGVYGLELTETTQLPDGGPAAVAMSQVLPGTAAAAMPGKTAKGQPIPALRLAFFHGTRVDAKHYRWIDPADPASLTPWAARVRNAELCSRPFQLLQILEAARRFSRIKAEGHHWRVGTVSATIDMLVTSVQGAAQLLDQHINAPGQVPQSISAAVASTPAAGAVANGVITDNWLTHFEKAYLAAVVYGKGIPVHDVIHPTTHKVIARGRQDRIVAAGQSTALRSFKGW